MNFFFKFIVPPTFAFICIRFSFPIVVFNLLTIEGPILRLHFPEKLVVLNYQGGIALLF